MGLDMQFSEDSCVNGAHTRAFYEDQRDEGGLCPNNSNLTKDSNDENYSTCSNAAAFLPLRWKRMGRSRQEPDDVSVHRRIQRRWTDVDDRCVLARSLEARFSWTHYVSSV